MSYVELAVLNMTNAVRKITVEKGIDPKEYSLCSLGSASGQIICRVAEQLGVSQIYIHPFAGLLSAYGIGLSEKRYSESTPINLPLVEENRGEILASLPQLKERIRSQLKAREGKSNGQWNGMLGLKTQNLRLPCRAMKLTKSSRAIGRSFKLNLATRINLSFIWKVSRSGSLARAPS